MSPLLIPILGISCGLLAIFGGVFLRPWFKLKERQLELTSAQTAEKAAQYASHVERLEQRVRVLERIATDKGTDVSAQIELLRDAPSLGQTRAHQGE
jgi:transposase